MHAIHAKVSRPPQRLAYGRPGAPRRVAVAANRRPVAGGSKVGAARRRQKEQQRSARVRREAVQDVDAFVLTVGRDCSDWLQLSTLKMLRKALEHPGVYEIAVWVPALGASIPVYLGQTGKLRARLGSWRSLLTGNRRASTTAEGELARIRRDTEPSEMCGFRIRYLKCDNPREVELGILSRYDYLLNKANNGQRRPFEDLRAPPAVDC